MTFLLAQPLKLYLPESYKSDKDASTYIRHADHWRIYPFYLFLSKKGNGTVVRKKHGGFTATDECHAFIQNSFEHIHSPVEYSITILTSSNSKYRHTGTQSMDSCNL